ncbi:unnamed protein product [Mytilus edulis]|uniref:PHD-type domain-containing protein n=1 Tax=Mytilus edulis TaxID=6550 RepID=A0A8S3UX80_MYTED|nr:unnamed protein product [Mytilus edulis]
MVLEDGLIKLPDPVKMLAGWEKTFINFPNTSATDVEDYIKLFRQIEAGCNKACTSKPQEWHKPHAQGKRVTQPDFVRNLVVKKVTGRFDTTPEDLKKKGNKSREQSNIEKNAGHPDIENIQIEEEVETISKTIPVLANEIIEAKQNINQCDFGEELLLNLDNSITDETVDYVVRKTCKQSSSKIWFDHRIGRITASVANECSKKVNEKDEVSEKNNSVVAKIFNYKSAPAYVKSLKWGRERELPAIKEYEKNAKGKHKDFNVQSTGLHICKENPWLAATPDSLIICDCCGLGCLEIKNPEKYKNDTIQQMATSDQSYLNYSDNKQISLDKKHQYYTQVQIQMYATNTKYADFVVKTVAADDNIFIQRIAYDEIFTMNVIHKCKVFFTKVIVQELLTHKVKLYYEKLQNNEQNSDQVFTNSNLEINEVVQEVDTGSATTCMNEDNTDIHVPSSNPAVVCPICSCECKDEPLTLNEESICCSKCDFWFHYPCVGIKGNENVVRSKYRNWFCKSCKGKK